MVKRLFDLTLALLLSLPALIIVALAVLAVSLDSAGSPFFKQVRVGRNRKPFTLVKLRTMASGTRSAPSHEIGTDAITRVGAFMRRSKIDELPQIWLVLTGAMSFVGPRPCLPSQGQLIAERDRLGVYSARPGITGVAQLAGVDMSTPVELAQIDAGYVTGQSLLGDLKILLATLLGRGMRDAVTPA